MARWTLTPLERFFKYVQKSEDPDGCWLWTGGKARGYGTWFVDGKSVRAHRFSYQQFVGEIPAGLYVLHDCPTGDNRSCVNPAHLWLGTHVDNMRDMKEKGRAATGQRTGVYTHPEKVRRGEQLSWTKLTSEQVREIRRRYALGGISRARLAIEYGVSLSMIRLIVRRECWKHIE